MSALPKPILRGHVARRGLKIIFGAFVVATLNSSLYYYFVYDARKKAVENFYKTYDADAHYEELAKYGYLHSTRKPS